MSYGNNYNEYSPYYEQPGLGQDGLRAGNTHQPNPYQPLSAYQSQKHHSAAQNANHSSSSYGEPGYGSVNSTGNPATYEARDGYGDGQSSVDATNLGNLAYASSLGRASTSSQQSKTYGSSSNYGLNDAAPASKGHNWVHSRRTSATSRIETGGSQAIAQSQYSGYHPDPTGNSSYPSQAYNANIGRNSPAQPQYATTQASHPPNQQYTPTQPAFQGVRPTSAQGGHPANSRIADQANQSPRFPSSQNTSLQSGGQQSKRRQNQPYTTNAPAPTIMTGSYPPARPQQSSAVHYQSGQSSTTNILQPGNASDICSPMQSPTVQAGGCDQPSHKQSPINCPRSQHSTPVQERYPTTVDPSHVFNDYEYQRRKDEEVAKKKAAEAARTTQPTAPGNNASLAAAWSGDAKSQSVSSQPNDILQAAREAIGSQAEADLATKDQMELEMKQMIEKMRDYKAKDPSLFSQIWEQVKKGQAPQATTAKPAAQGASASPPVTNGLLASPIQSELPAESELPAASSFPPDFDRGRFPYQRRRRGALQSPAFRGTKSRHKIARFEQPWNPIPLMTTAPLSPAAPVAQTTPDDMDQTDQRLYAAMQTFHQSLQTPIPAPNSSHEEAPPPPPPFDNTKPSESKPAKPTATPVQKTKPKPKPPPAGDTYWPEHKKRAMAEAARTVLKKNPSNIGKQITIDEIHALLDQNPSYTQLCDHLEDRGFVIERGHFARFLLNAVPDMVSLPPTSSATNSAPPPNPMPSQQQSNGYASPNAPTPPPSNGQNQSGHNFQRRPVDQSVSDQERVYVSGKVLNGPNTVIQPVTKEDKARKRNFGDIVDLTQAVSDDEDFERHSPKSKTDQSSKNGSLDPAKVVIDRTGASTPSGVHTKKQDEPRISSTGRDHILKERVVEPMNARRDARRCSSYDPKTIARDILISSGKHPTMAPLNHHLEVLRNRFDYVNNDSDLSTFRWDVVDPSEKLSKKQTIPTTLTNIMNQDADNKVWDDVTLPELSSKLTEKEISSRRGSRPRKHPSPEAMGDGISTSVGATSRPQSDKSASFHDQRIKAGSETSIFRPPAIAQDVASVSNKHQQELNSTRQQLPSSQVPVNHQGSSALINSFAFTPVATSKIPLNAGSSNLLSSPVPPPGRSTGAHCLRCRTQHKPCNGQQPCSHCRQAGINAEGCIIEEDESGNLPPLAKSQALAKPPPSTKRLSSARTAILSSPFPPVVPTPSSQKKEVAHGRIGRPPGAKNKQPRPDKGIPKGPRTPHPSPLTAKPMRPRFQAEYTPRRNSGLRNAIGPTNGIAVVIQSRSPSVAGSESQFGSKAVVKTEETAPIYKSYKCGWNQCPAELHNLETLRKHVRKHRKGLDKPIPCEWTECRENIHRDETGNRMRFNDEAAWDKHVDKKHIRVMAKVRGDVLGADSDEDSSDRSSEDEIAA